MESMEDKWLGHKMSTENYFLSSSSKIPKKEKTNKPEFKKMERLMAAFSISTQQATARVTRVCK